MTKTTVTEVTRPLDQTDGAKIQTPAQLAAINPDLYGVLMCAVNHATDDDVGATLRDFLGAFSAFGEVPNVAGLGVVPVDRKVVRVATNRLLYRTINGGASWVPLSKVIDVDTDAELATITEQLPNQLAVVSGTGYIRIWDDTAAEWTYLADRTYLGQWLATTVSPFAPPFSAPGVVQQIASLSVVAGNDATFTFKIANFSKAWWQVSSDSGTTWDDVPAEHTDTLVIHSPTAADNGKQYRCVAADNYNFGIVSNVAILTVT